MNVIEDKQAALCEKAYIEKQTDIQKGITKFVEIVQSLNEISPQTRDRVLESVRTWYKRRRELDTVEKEEY